MSQNTTGTLVTVFFNSDRGHRHFLKLTLDMGTPRQYHQDTGSLFQASVYSRLADGNITFGASQDYYRDQVNDILWRKFRR